MARQINHPRVIDLTGDPKAPPEENGVKKVVTATKNLIGTGFQGIGAGGAYLEQVPIFGPMFVRPLAFMGSNIQDGYLDAKTRIAARKAAKGQDPVGQAESTLSPEEKDALQMRAKAAAAGA